MNLIQSILTQNPCYKAGRKITVKGLMLHSVGCPQPSAAVFVRNWNKASYDRACVHAFIDGNTGDVYQCLPWNHRGWHGGGSSNNTHIGVEMCEPACIKYTGGAGAKFEPYRVRVKATDLNIRSGPGTNNPSKGFIPPGVYTIVAESTGKGATKWGKLKSGAGWISLDYAKRV